VSDTVGQAADFLANIRTELTDNEDLRNIFGIGNLIKDNETEIVGRYTDGGYFRLIAKGAEQSMRGMLWRNKRPNLILCDDLENDEIVMNEERRFKFKKWFYNTLLPIGSKSCSVRVVGTILHMDALLENLMPPLVGSGVDKSNPLKDVQTADSSWKAVRYRAHNYPDFDHILWRDQFDQKRLEYIRADYIEQGMPEGYAQEYLNYPLDEENAYFKMEDFIAIDHNVDEPEEYYMACDLAISEKKQRAYTTYVIVGVNNRNTIRVREVIRFRGDSLEILDKLFDAHIRWNFSGIFIEEENISRTLGPVIDKEMVERGMFLPIETMPTQGIDKIRRARAIQQRMRAGYVEFDTHAPWFESFQMELLQFPRSTFVDQVDAFAWIGLGLNKIIEAKTYQQILDEEYEDEFKEAGYHGQNPVTGY